MNEILKNSENEWGICVKVTNASSRVFYVEKVESVSYTHLTLPTNREV